jgi:hypothetical protein
MLKTMRELDSKSKIKVTKAKRLENEGIKIDIIFWLSLQPRA